MTILNDRQYHVAKIEFDDDIHTVSQLSTQTIQSSLQLGYFDPKGELVNSLRSIKSFEAAWILDKKLHNTKSSFAHNTTYDIDNVPLHMIQQLHTLLNHNTFTAHIHNDKHSYNLNHLHDEDGEEIGYLLLVFNYTSLQQAYADILHTNIIVAIVVFIPLIAISTFFIYSISRNNRSLNKEIHERIQLSEHLADSEKRFRNLSDLMPVGIVLQGKDGRIVFENQHQSTLYNIIDNTHEDKLAYIKKQAKIDDQELNENWMNLHQEHTSISREFIIPDINKQLTGEQWLETASCAISINNEQCFVHIMTDISERKRQEQENELLHKKMLGLVREAGKAEVATSVLHNVGNILNSVNISCHKLQDISKKSRLGKFIQAVNIYCDSNNGKTDEQRLKSAQKYIRLSQEHIQNDQIQICEESEKLQRNIEHIKSVINDQQHDAKSVFIEDPCNLQEIKAEVIEFCQEYIENNQCVLQDDFIEPTKVLMIDKHKIIQILVNMVKNSCEAMSESKQRIVRLSNKYTDNTLYISVEDSGPGISPDNRQKIFSNGYTTKNTGHGFGLHGSANLASEMKGKLTLIESSLGGAAFNLAIPLVVK